MTVSCRAVGGPPTPHIDWTFPDNVEHRPVTDITNTLEDGSLESLSEVTFTPAFTEDLEVIQCHAINDVMTEPITTEAVLDIECKLTMESIILVLLRLMIQSRPV